MGTVYIPDFLNKLTNALGVDLKKYSKESPFFMYHIIKSEAEIIIDPKLRKEIENTLFSKITYNGLFSHSTYATSDITSTYYATMILDKLGERDNDIIRYIENNLNDKKIDTSRMATSEVLMLMQIAKKYNIELDKAFINHYFNITFEKALSVNYERNKNLILLLFETASLYNYKYIEENSFLEKIFDVLDAYENNNEMLGNDNDSNIITLQFVNECVNLRILYLIDPSKVSRDRIENLINKYSQNYNMFLDRLYVTAIMVPLLEKVEYTNIRLPEDIVYDLKKQLNTHTKHKFFMYSTYDTPDFESTFSCLNIIKFLQQK